MQIIQLSNQENIAKVMRDIEVDPCGIKIMVPKAVNFLVRINSVSNIAANILKQEMLSLGGDVAVSRDSLTGGRHKKTDCLLIGNLSQINRLKTKLYRQPFGLSKLGGDLSENINNYQKDKFTLDLGGWKLNLGKRTHIMGILNLTPDSFSGDGVYSSSSVKHTGLSSIGKIVDSAKKMAADGADIIDLGGESSRPGASPVSLKEELSRVVPVVKKLVKEVNVPLSIDTYKPEVARQALDNGVSIVNDITGLRDRRMVKVAAEYKAAVVIMHMKGMPRSMQKNVFYKSLISQIIEYLDKAIKTAVSGGVAADKIIIDAGIGFGKTLEHNLQILKQLREFKILGRPLLVGTSRKSFIGKILNVLPEKRIFGTLASCLVAAQNGANIVRVHDVKETKQSLKILEYINKI